MDGKTTYFKEGLCVGKFSEIHKKVSFVYKQDARIRGKQVQLLKNVVQGRFEQKEFPQSENFPPFNLNGNILFMKQTDINLFRVVLSYFVKDGQLKIVSSHF